SDFIGFGDLETILIHRGIYLCLGLGFIFSTILLIRRLPQSKIMNIISFVLAAGFIVTGVTLGHTYLARLSAGKTLRSDMVALNRSLVESPRVTVDSYEIDLVHNGDEIDVNAWIVRPYTFDKFFIVMVIL
ncbi:hypothetical protein ACFL47_05690, partial [Candidatus Latescibacterota bacterium]